MHEVAKGEEQEATSITTLEDNLRVVLSRTRQLNTPTARKARITISHMIRILTRLNTKSITNQDPLIQHTKHHIQKEVIVEEVM